MTADASDTIDTGNHKTINHSHLYLGLPLNLCVTRDSTPNSPTHFDGIKTFPGIILVPCKIKLLNPNLSWKLTEKVFMYFIGFFFEIPS